MLGQREVNMFYACKFVTNHLQHRVTAHVMNKLFMAHAFTETNFSMNTATVLQYSFTCIVAGCTQCGKTVWVKTLLENIRKR